MILWVYAVALVVIVLIAVAVSVAIAYNYNASPSPSSTAARATSASNSSAGSSPLRSSSSPCLIHSPVARYYSLGGATIAAGQLIKFTRNALYSDDISPSIVSTNFGTGSIFTLRKIGTYRVTYQTHTTSEVSLGIVQGTSPTTLSLVQHSQLTSGPNSVVNIITTKSKYDKIGIVAAPSNSADLVIPSDVSGIPTVTNIEISLV